MGESLVSIIHQLTNEFNIKIKVEITRDASTGVDQPSTEATTYIWVKE